LRGIISPRRRVTGHAGRRDAPKLDTAEIPSRYFRRAPSALTTIINCGGNKIPPAEENSNGRSSLSFSACWLPLRETDGERPDAKVRHIWIGLGAVISGAGQPIEPPGANQV
jgi:hypothetical protein